MSSRAKAISKNMEHDFHCSLPLGMYTVFPGSVLVCYMMFEKVDETEKKRIVDLWKKIQKKPLKYYHTAEDFYNPEFTLKVFECERTYDWKVAVFVGKTNTLLAPYEEIDGKMYAYPLREDGLSGPTLAHPVSAHVLKWSSENESDNSNSNIS